MQGLAACSLLCFHGVIPDQPSGWHQLKHGSKAARGNREQKQSLGELIRLHCQVGLGRAPWWFA